MSLTVRAYNVLFGDAILLSWDEDDGAHHAWIDFGNMLGSNQKFGAVFDDVKSRTGGKLDLLVVTHRHLDHLEGFHSLRKRFKNEFRVERLWHAHVTAALDQQFDLALRRLNATVPASARTEDGLLGRMWRNNFSPGMKKNMDEILSELGAKQSHAVFRGMDLVGTGAKPPGWSKMSVSVLGPEKDSGVYLAPLQDAIRARAALSGAPGSTGGAKTRRTSPPPTASDREELERIRRSADFQRLRRLLRTSDAELLALVDKTRNNTSVVLRFTYRGTKVRKLLFAGDAEDGSWAVMRKNGAPLSADLVKVAHHGSVNASPEWSFAKVFPQRRRTTAVVLSTCPGVYGTKNPVPFDKVVEGWGGRLSDPAKQLSRTDRVPEGESVVVKVLP